MTIARRVRAVAAAVALLAPTSAHAFCRTTTVAVAADFQPGPTRCWDQGKPLYWESACVGFDIQRNASRQFSYEQASKGIADAFGRWSSASCATPNGGSSRASIDFRDLGPVDCAEATYNLSGPNQNVIVFRDDAWPFRGAGNALGITTVSYDPDTGKLYDADMEINTYNVTLSMETPTPSGTYDFASVLTHEAGHFLGLQHSGDQHATMFASYAPTMRNLAQDDVLGICSIYLPDGHRSGIDGQVVASTACDPTPRRGLTNACEEKPKDSCFGSSITGHHETRAGWLTAVAIAGLAVGRRQRARRRSA